MRAVAWRQAVRSVLALCVLAVLCGAGEWTRLRSDHFVLYTNGEQARGRELLRHLEWLHAAYAALSAEDRNPTAPQRPIEVFHFRDEATYLPFRVASEAPAFHVNGRGRNSIVVHEFHDHLLELVNHEYFHAYAQQQGWRLPAWLGEGLADYFATIAEHKPVGASEGAIWAGHPIPRHVSQLTAPNGRGQSFSVNALFAQQGPAMSAHDPDMRLELYAQSWLLAHMLLREEPWRRRFPEFLAALMAVGSERALADVYGKRPEDMDAAVRAYLLRGRIEPAPAATGSTRVPVRIEEDPLADWEAPLLLADLLAMLGKQRAAQAQLELLSSQYPEVARIEESRGQLALEMLDLKSAQRHFEEAVRQSSTNPEVYHRLATLRCGMQSEEADCLDWVERSLAADGGQREFLQYAVDFSLNVHAFARALRYMERMHPESEEERFQLMMKRSFAHYRMDAFPEARTALGQADAIAGTPGRRRQVEDFRKAIADREEYVLQSLLFSAPAVGDEEKRRHALARVLERFAASADARLEDATLKEIQCESGSLAVLVDSPSGRLRLAVRDAMNLMVIRGSRRVRELDLFCGSQSDQRVRVGYLRAADVAESGGVLRILILPDADAARN